MKITTIILSIIFFIFSFNTIANEISILFIGNSYTYLPGLGSPDDPALPKLMNQIVQSIDKNLSLKYSFNTPGSYTYEKHFNDSKSQTLLKNSYDYVILQGQSIESLELPPAWQKYGIGYQSFSVYLPKIINLAHEKNSNITMFVDWGWNFKNSNLQPGAEGLLFPPGNKREGQPWCGKDKFELQKMINESYQTSTSPLSVSLSMIGDSWLSLQLAGLVGEDDLYLKDDWSHPSALGAYVEALVLTKDALNLDISKATYAPLEINQNLAKKIRDFLALNK